MSAAEPKFIDFLRRSTSNNPISMMYRAPSFGGKPGPALSGIFAEICALQRAEHHLWRIAGDAWLASDRIGPQGGAF